MYTTYVCVYMDTYIHIHATYNIMHIRQMNSDQSLTVTVEVLKTGARHIIW